MPSVILQLLFAVVCCQACAGAFIDVVLFGDSLSDDCTHGASNVVDEVLGTDQLYPGPPYYKGCVFSNGPVYMDIAAGLLNVTAQNYAVGGATSGAVTGVLGIPRGFANRTAATSINVPSTLEQAEMYIDSNNDTLSNTTLYVIYIGGNDYIDTLAGLGNATVQTVLNYTTDAMEVLYDAGARMFLTQTLPSIGQTPAVASRGRPAMVLADALTARHNAGLAIAAMQFATDHPDASVLLFDFYNFSQGLRNNASQYNITDLNNPCYNGRVAGQSLLPLSAAPTVCNSPDNHAFWDAIHPTAIIHQLWGEAIAAHLQPYLIGDMLPTAALISVNGTDAVQSSQLQMFGQEV